MKTLYETSSLVSHQLISYWPAYSVPFRSVPHPPTLYTLLRLLLLALPTYHLIPPCAPSFHRRSPSYSSLPLPVYSHFTPLLSSPEVGVGSRGVLSVLVGSGSILYVYYLMLLFSQFAVTLTYCNCNCIYCAVFLSVLSSFPK
ncbi:hypothetical protein BDV19DRAFT_202784 [Aspergillus venezuelensis]